MITKRFSLLLVCVGPLLALWALVGSLQPPTVQAAPEGLTATEWQQIQTQIAADMAATGNLTQTAIITASDPAQVVYFGYSVAIDGDTAVISAYGNDSNTGAVYVFTRTGITWIQQQKLTASDAAEGDTFGTSVAVAGDTAVIGAHGKDSYTGAVYVFTRAGTTWTEQQKLAASDAAESDRFGISVAIAGETAVIGAFGDDTERGAAYVFTRTDTTWTEQQKLTASDAAPADRFGTSVAIDGETAVIGAYQKSSYRGAAYVYTRADTTWTEQQKLTASDAASNDKFGFSVAVAGDTAVIGAFQESSDSGAAYVYTRADTTWTEQQKLTASDATQGDYFGHSVAVAGDTAVIGAFSKNNNTGRAYVFTRADTTWMEQQKLTASDAAQGDYFGLSVAIDGDTVVIGAYRKNSSTGAAYVFEQTSYDIFLPVIMRPD